MGCPFCIKTAPIPSPHASVSMVKGSVKFGRANTGVHIMADLSVMKALSA